MAPLVPLFHQAFARPHFTPAWLNTKYGYEYGGVPGFSCVAFTEDGEVAAAFGVLPAPIRFGARVEIAGQLIDAATAEGHRRRGLFSRLDELASEVCSAAGIAFLLAFPHPQGESYPGFVGSLGYQHIDDLVEFRRPIRTLWAERMASRAGALRPLYAGYVDRTLSRHAPPDPGLENSLLRDGAAGVDRDRAFHAYKSALSGSRVLALDGGRAWLKAGRGLLVGDLEAGSDDDLARSAHSLERLAARLGVHQVVFQASKDARYSAFFAERYGSEPGLAVVYRDLSSQIPPHKLRFTWGDVDTF